MTAAPDLPTKKAPQLTPPSLDENVAAGSARKLIILLLILLFFTIGVLIYGVLIFLPERTANTQLATQLTTSGVPRINTALETKRTKEPVQTVPVEAAEEITGKKHALAALQKFLEMQSRLEAENIGIWGGVRYQTIVTNISAGDSYLHSKKYAQAGQLYEEAGKRLNDLLDQKETIFQQALQDGAFQINEKNSVLARAAYKTAIAIHPENERARQGMNRAHNLDRVLELFSLGREYEEKGKLDLALKAFQDSHNLDQQFKPAVVGVQRIKEALKQHHLTDALTHFYGALQKSELKLAEVALKSAITIDPADPEVMRASREFKHIKEEQTIALLRLKAQMQSGAEEWQEALDIYLKILKLTPRADFALHGQEIARNNVALSGRLDDLLNNRQRLQDDRILQNAEATFAYATSRSGFGPKMTAKISALGAAITQARIPVTLTLLSDNQTQVTIYHVGRLGTFHQKELTLKPGQYTIIGERSGYRDVRYTITLTNTAVTFTIACKETF